MIDQTVSYRIGEIKRPVIEKRKPLRLKEYDYSLEGSYFVTVCTKDREELFGHIVDGSMRLNRYGEIVQTCWKELMEHYPTVMLDEYAIMPNHIHGIIIIIDDIVGARHASPLQGKHRSLGNIIGSFKSAATKYINEIRNTPVQSIWQRSYYDHIIRSEKSFQRIREYIYNNPAMWGIDKENTEREGDVGFEKWLIEEGKQKIKSRKIL